MNEANTAAQSTVNALAPQPIEQAAEPRKSGAALRRELLEATDITTRQEVEIEGEKLTVLIWGRKDRKNFRDAMKRAKAGEPIIENESLETMPDGPGAENGACSAYCAALLGLEGEAGSPYFDMAEILAYENDIELSDFLAKSIWAVYEANPKIWAPELLKEATQEAEQSSESEDVTAPEVTAEATKAEVL